MGRWYVISLRPLNQHASVRTSAARLGATTFALSTVALQPLEAAAQLRKALACLRVLVTSPAAARLAHAQVPLARRSGQRWFALGSGSAKALHRCGIEHVLLPTNGSDSEALLAHPELKHVSGDRIGLITAPGGRGLLASELRARGATVVVAEVYRRQPLRISTARLRALDALPAKAALLITSSEAISLLWQALDGPARTRLLQRPCVVSSERLSGQVRSLGFATILRATDARPASLLASVALHAAGTGFR